MLTYELVEPSERLYQNICDLLAYLSSRTAYIISAALGVCGLCFYLGCILLFSWPFPFLTQLLVGLAGVIFSVYFLYVLSITLAPFRLHWIQRHFDAARNRGVFHSTQAVDRSKQTNINYVRLQQEAKHISKTIDAARLRLGHIRSRLMLEHNDSEYKYLETVGVLVNILDNHLYRLTEVLCAPNIAVDTQLVRCMEQIDPAGMGHAVPGLVSKMKLEDYELMLDRLLTRAERSLPSAA